jgi:hypothetical protein
MTSYSVLILYRSIIINVVSDKLFYEELFCLAWSFTLTISSLKEEEGTRVITEQIADRPPAENLRKVPLLTTPAQ